MKMTEQEYKKFFNEDLAKLILQWKSDDTAPVYARYLYDYFIDTNRESCYSKDGNVDINKLNNILNSYEKKEKSNYEEILFSQFAKEEDDNFYEEITADRWNKENINPANILEESSLEDKSLQEEKIKCHQYFSSVFNEIAKLREEQKNRLYAVYFLIENEIMYNSAKSPSKMQKATGEILQAKYQGGHASSKWKYLYIKEQYNKSGFWDKFQDIYRQDLSFNGIKQLSVKYEKCRKSFTKNPKRDIKSICDIILKDLPENIKNLIRTDILHFTYTEKLKDIPQNSLFLVHDIYMNKIYNLRPCKNVSFEQIFAFIQAKIEGDENFITNNAELKNHILDCSKCSEFCEAWEEVLSYRKERLGQKQFNCFEPHIKNCDNVKTKKQEISAEKKEKTNNIQTNGSDYIIGVGCICGVLDRYNTYKLNHLRTKEVQFGAKDNEGYFAQINVCRDDENTLSRKQCFLEYDDEKEDWYIISAGKNEASKIINGENIYYITKAAYLEILQKVKARSIKDEKLACENPFTQKFIQLKNEKAYLADIALICFIPCDNTSENCLYFNKMKVEGIWHPKLGKLPFGWYIEILKSRTTKSVFESYAENSIIAADCDDSTINTDTKIK